MKQFFTFCFFVAVLAQYFSFTEYVKEAKAPGDIIIGGLFPIHESVELGNNNCNRFSHARLAQSLMMIHAIEKINQRDELGGITLGYLIRDSCGDVTTALNNTLSFMSKIKFINTEDTYQSSSPILAVIGDYYSEISVPVTRLLNLESIPEVSYGATSGLLSDKTRFPSFLRTVPEDDHQTLAITKILKEHNWTMVGVVTTDGEYGRYAVKRLQEHASKHGICFAFTSVLPEFLVNKKLKGSINETVNNIIENKDVKVIVSFAKSNHMEEIFDQLLQDSRGRNKVWLASDNWSQSADALDTSKWSLTDVGTVFGTNLKSGNASQFKQFLHHLNKTSTTDYKNNSFLMDFLNENNSCTSGKPSIMDLINKTQPSAVFSIELAVKAIAQAVSDLCINKNCNLSTLKPSEFRDALQKANFTLNGKNYSFDENFNLNTGYDVILWKYTSDGILDTNYIVQHYDIGNQQLINNSETPVFDNLIRNVTSKCPSCARGQRKLSYKNQSVCCYACIKCPKNYYSNISDSEECYKCNEKTEYSGEGSAKCEKKIDMFLKWDDPYHIVLLVFTALGILLTLTVGIIFLACWNTPVVRSSVRLVSIILLLSLLSTFGSVFIFGGEPSDWKCRARQVDFGLSFTLSVSCILVKSFKIVLAFQFNSRTQNVLQKLYKPYLIIALCMIGQVLICIVWLSINPPEEVYQPEQEIRQWYCDEKLPATFGAMLVYIGLLAIICFVVAFKGRKLPQCYNDAKFITFSMLIFFIAWIIFGPVHVTVTGKYLPAVEMIVILFSAYGILFCQFFPKCYIILFKREANTLVAFREDIRNFSAGKDQDKDGNWCSSSSVSDGIPNPAFSPESVPNPEPSDPHLHQQL
ncbi:G-protein coupled receptor family C group 6 member A-like isoform X1 [Kryptolebias marmoratus]|uniref:G-protein coupled receptor family C group 6 member A-like isoform X1 n=2 Tax=Kryptolebias marmoratus TaxID=37003 RepID=UPI0007F8D31F|nr:G-protein coupled receptor family C group 6 member A-like isoform X1 [Kryptolebias marmoratus]